MVAHGCTTRPTQIDSYRHHLEVYLRSVVLQIQEELKNVGH